MENNDVPLPTQAAKTSFEMLDTAVIDDPERAMRTDLTADSVADLAMSIRQIGVVEPLVVQPAGERYEVVAGHRRLTAANVAGVGRVPCYIVEGTQEQIEMMKIHENLYRVEVSPLDEAKHYERLIKDMHLTPGKIAQLIGRGDRYVTDRLRLLRMDEQVKRALVDQQINLTTALELSRIDDPIKLGEMLSYLRGAAVSSSTVKRWVDEQLAAYQQDTPGVPTPPEPSQPIAPQEQHVDCFYCLNPVSLMDGRTVWVHDDCIAARQQMANEPEDGGREE